MRAVRCIPLNGPPVQHHASTQACSLAHPDQQTQIPPTGRFDCLWKHPQLHQFVMLVRVVRASWVCPGQRLKGPSGLFEGSTSIVSVRLTNLRVRCECLSSLYIGMPSCVPVCLKNLRVRRDPLSRLCGGSILRAHQVNQRVRGESRDFD